jgi:putative tryptophan/tyrosine transport system substrate-binding protein
MKRREFITLVGAAAAWPLSARTQQGERMRRIGVLMLGDESDPDQLSRVGAFRAELARSISRPPRRSASKYRRCSSPAPTR